MIKKVFLVCFFKLIVVNSQQLEDVIYKELDDFLAQKTQIAFQKLEEQEKVFEKKVGTKKEHLALVILQCNKAFFLKEKNKLQPAIVAYENAWNGYQKQQLANYDIIEFCLKPLGNLYTQSKDYANAEYIIKYYISLAEKEKKAIQKIAGIINLSKVYQSVNKHNFVIQMIDEVLKENHIKTSQKKTLKIIKSNSLLALGNIKGENNIIVLEQIPKEQDFYYLKYKESLQIGNYTKAKTFFDTYKDQIHLMNLNSRERAKLFLEEAQLFLLTEEVVKANKTLDNALASLIKQDEKSEMYAKEMLFAESLLIDVFDMKAVLSSNIEKSLSNYDKSFYVASLLATQITSQETQIILQANKRKRSEKCIALLLEQYQKNPKQLYLEKALSYADKGKANILKDRSYKKELRKKHPTDSLLKIENVLLQKQEIISAKILELQTASKANATMSEFSKELNHVSIEIKKVQDKIRQKYPKNEVFISVVAVKEKLEEKNAVLVHYFYGEQNIYQFVINKDTITVNTIAKSVLLEKEIVNYIQLFNTSISINNDVVNYTKKAFELYKKLHFDAIASYKNVVVVPDGLLSFIPFETLLTQTTQETFYSNMPFVVYKHSVSYDFNLSMFLNAVSEDKNKTILGVFPVFENTNLELQYSLDEAKVIEKYFSSIVLKKEKATKSNFSKNLNKVSIIHLSTHAGTQKDSKIAYVRFCDKVLTLNELYAEESKANLVVLSACETGVGNLFKGTIPLSIARGFNYIGVDNLLFSLWKINDKSTAELIKYFYQSYKKNNSISNANQQSKITYLKNDTLENSRKSPYYWGSFVYYGTPDFKVDYNWFCYLILFVILLFMLLLIKKRFYLAT